jgi:predicted unusual protein kinase regulating ubiquinone biosynthesis (AarF/ABC1/UbiB family)
MLTVRDSYLRALPPDERAKVIADMVRAAREPATEADVEQLNEELATYELAHGMSTEAMRRGLQAGTVEETLSVCQWIMRASLRDHLKQCLANNKENQ